MLSDSLFVQQIFTVSEVTGYVRVLLEENPDLQDIWVQGEVSNVSTPSSGHIYFTLKDAGASLRCVIWKWTAQYLHTKPQDGMAVEVHGKFGVYEKSGQYQLYVDAVRSQGEGKLYQEFLLLKEKLEAEGLFAAERKKVIPAYPDRIGVVTSATGAALQDILNTLRNRYPVASVILSPSMVQGSGAAETIIDALNKLEELDIPPDVIIVARGGGSLEDLWSFNEEKVVRAVAALEIPVISGVGHETDFTLVDFAADLRAPTPTGAAVAAVPDIQELQISLDELQQILAQQTVNGINDRRQALMVRQYQIAAQSPKRMVEQSMMRLDDLAVRLNGLIQTNLRGAAARLETVGVHLRALDPQAVLQRGYALVFDKQGKLVDSVEKTSENETVDIHLQDGVLDASILKVKHREN